MKRYLHLLLPAMAMALVACSRPRLPPPNSVDARYDEQSRTVQVMVSSRLPASDVVLISPEGVRYPAPGVSLVSGPHVLYNPPPSIGLGIGGFSFGGGGTGFGSGVGVGVPLGRPTLAEVSDQYVASAQVAAPDDYAARWRNYRLEILIGGQLMSLAAPPLSPA
jgi:hypothetical protein